LTSQCKPDEHKRVLLRVRRRGGTDSYQEERENREREDEKKANTVREFRPKRKPRRENSGGGGQHKENTAMPHLDRGEQTEQTKSQNGEGETGQMKTPKMKKEACGSSGGRPSPRSAKARREKKRKCFILFEGEHEKILVQKSGGRKEYGGGAPGKTPTPNQIEAPQPIKKRVRLKENESDG